MSGGPGHPTRGGWSPATLIVRTYTYAHAHVKISTHTHVPMRSKKKRGFRGKWNVMGVAPGALDGEHAGEGNSYKMFQTPRTFRMS